MHLTRSVTLTIKESNMRLKGISIQASLFFCGSFLLFVLVKMPYAQTQQNTPVAAPAWAQPGSATHTQVAPPPDFHRPSKNFDQPIGIFDGQSDIGSALVPGSTSFDASSSQYTINSAGYNVWYTRDEFRFLWKKMSGD